MSHIVNSCPLTKFDGGLLRLQEADEAAVDWLTAYGSQHTIIIIILRWFLREFCTGGGIQKTKSNTPTRSLKKL